MTRDRRSRRSGFTLVELLVVIAIIALLMSLILVAAADGVRRAEERATQALITKLETGLNDRLDALLNAQAPVNQTHRYLAAINYSSSVHSGNYIPVGTMSSSGSDERRAQVIAQFDYIRAEMPDVFFVNAQTSDGGGIASYYPINCASSPYPATGSSTANTTYLEHIVPLGNLTPGLPYYIDPNNPNNLNLSTNPPQNAPLGSVAYPPNSGVFGASFSALGGITKNLGYAPQGYDGIDNNNDADHLVDEMAEGVPAGLSLDAFQAQVKAQLANHTHKTARAEMLYAVLVNGLGPLGSVFNQDEFTDREVKDTDNDGLPEFVDAWGEPLQFFRWPVYFGAFGGVSDTQKGSAQYGGDSSAPYGSYSEVRQIDPLDQNQLLVAPGWWSSASNPSLPYPYVQTFTSPTGNGGDGESQGAIAFMQYFHILVDPLPFTYPDTTGYLWDRTGSFARRSYFTKFLLLSAGPDKEPGIGQFGKDYSALTSDSTGPLITFPDSTLTMAANTSRLIFIENQASQSNPDPHSRQGSFLQTPDKSTTTTAYLQTNAGLDDISNHNIQAPGSGVR